MKITLVSLDNWGFNSNIAVALEKKGHIIRHIDFNEFKYKYTSFSHRIYNFLLKTFLNKISLCSSLPFQVSTAVTELVFFNRLIKRQDRPSKLPISK